MRSVDIVWTNASLVEQGIADGIELDLVSGDTDDFEAAVPSGCDVARGSAIAIVGTEYGGIVDDISSTSTDRRLRVKGRSWGGVLGSRIIKPPAGEDYYTFDGDAHAVMGAVVQACDLSYLFHVPSSASGIHLTGRFDRFTDAASGLRKALRRAGARLSAEWDGSGVELSCAAVATVEVDALSVPVTVEDARPINHLVLLGSGDLEERLVRDVYADAAGNVSTTQSLFGADLVEAAYELSNCDDAAELLAEGMDKLSELQVLSPIEVSLNGISADLHVGDLVHASDDASGISTTAEVARVVVKVKNGVLDVSYDAGTVTSSQTWSGGGSSSGGGGGGTLDYNALYNKPSIESVTLVGNKTFSNLGLDRLTNSEIESLLAAAG